MAPADQPKKAILKKKIDSSLVIFIAIIINITLTIALIMAYNRLGDEVNRVEQLQKANLQLELIILQTQGIRLVPKKEEKPNII